MYEYMSLVLVVAAGVVMLALHMRKQHWREAAYELISLNGEIEHAQDKVEDARSIGDKVAEAEWMRRYEKLTSRQAVLFRRMRMR